MPSSKKTIVFISNKSKLFGAPKILLDIIKYFHSTEKYNIIVVCPAEGPFKTILDRVGIQTLIPDCLRDYYLHISQPSNFFIHILQRIYDNFRLLFYFYRLIRDYSNPILYANTSVVRYIALPKLITRTSLLWHVHEYFENPLKQKFHSVLIGYCTNKIIIHSTILNSRLGLSKRAQAKVFSLRYLLTLDPKSYYLIKSDRPCYDLMFAGRISLEKGVLDLLKAIKSYLKIRDKIKVLIIGLFVEKDKQIILDYVANNKLDKYITFHDFDPEIYQYILNAKAVVLPSHRESFGLILLEAVMLDKPVIATDVGDVLSVVTPGLNGILISPRNIEQLENAISQMLDENVYKRYLAGVKQKKKEILSDKSSYRELEDVVDLLIKKTPNLN